MQVSEIMTKNAVKIAKNTTIQEAAQKMQELDCGFLPVGSDDKLEGVVTDRDIVLRAVAKGKTPQNVTVSEVLTNKVLYCLEDDDIKNAAKQMKQAQVYRLVVVNNDKEKRLRGIVTLGDISRQFQDPKLIGETSAGVAKHAA